VLFARLDFTSSGSLSYSEFIDRINGWKKKKTERDLKVSHGIGGGAPTTIRRTPSSHGGVCVCVCSWV